MLAASLFKSVMRTSYLAPSMRAFSKVSGTVKFFDSQKGFGFITPQDGSADVFVHQSSIHAEGFRSLAEGENVEYEVVHDEKKGKSSAANVTGPGGAFVKGAPRQMQNDFGGRSRGPPRGGGRGRDREF